MSKSFNDLNLTVVPCADIRNMLEKVEFKSFSLVQGKVLRALQFCVCEFEDNCDHTTRFTEWWLNLIVKCLGNTVLKVDAQIREERCQIISYLKGCYTSYPKLAWKKLSNQKPTQNTDSGGALTILRAAEHHKQEKKVTKDARDFGNHVTVPSPPTCNPVSNVTFTVTKLLQSLWIMCFLNHEYTGSFYRSL